MRQIMDSKANTLICDSPIAHTQVDGTLTMAPSAYLIMVAGGIPGTMLRLGEHRISLGRAIENSFQLGDSTVSRHHALVWMDPRGSIYLNDQGSTNGTFLNGHRMAAHGVRQLQDGDRVQLGTRVVLKLVRLDPSDERFQREMFERTVRDTLTGLYNRAYFLNQIGTLGAQYAVQGIGLAILMLDVDHFKRVNDRFGHTAGDRVLREVATVIRESTRAEDLVARYGGEEFVVALPVSAPDLAIDRAERIRSSLVGRCISVEGAMIRVTASIGISFGPPGRSCDELTLIAAADQALYQAKDDGRDRVVFGPHLRQSAWQETESAEFLIPCE
jgi:diguanylate cyclase (GGDEF)-like protein